MAKDEQDVLSDRADISASTDSASRWRALTPDGADLRFQDFLTYKVGRLHSLISREVTPSYLGASGLTLPEWRLLARLGTYSSLEMRQLTRINLMDKAAISRATDGLVDKGLVGRHVDPVHATRRIIAVTPAGRRLLRKIMPAAQREQAALLGALTVDERVMLDTVLAKLTDALLSRSATPG